MGTWKEILGSAVLAAFLGCGGGSGAGQAPQSQGGPAIASFTATPALTTAGHSVSLLAVFTGGTGAVSPGVGAVASGVPATVAPATTTVYTLTVTGATAVTATTTITVGATGTVYGDLTGADLGPGASLNGALPFPADNPWNTDISGSPADPNSDALIASIGLTTGLHPDFGAGTYQGAYIGIPYVVVASTQPLVPVVFEAYGDESDPGPYPVPAAAPIEGQTSDGSAFGGDRHVLVIQKDANRLYELDNAFLQSGGSWQADCGALFHLDSHNVRPGAQPGWTSADAAGLPIFPGLVRYDEVSSSAGIRHALRFTVNSTRKAYVPPANHWASSSTSANLPPMGMRVRLKASFAIPAAFSAETRAILQALKTYGMLVADNGSNWYLSGAPDPRWDNDSLVSQLAQVPGSAFEVVKMVGLVAP